MKEKKKKKSKGKYKIFLTRFFVKLHVLLLNMLLANYKEELIFFGIDIWQEIIRTDFTYQKKKKKRTSQKIFESTFFSMRMYLLQSDTTTVTVKRFMRIISRIHTPCVTNVMHYTVYVQRSYNNNFFFQAHPIGRGESESVKYSLRKIVASIHI